MVVSILANFCRPLIVVGKGAAYAQADAVLRRLVAVLGAPFLATAMGRGVVPDSHPLNVNAARSQALAEADVALIIGARLASILNRSLTLKSHGRYFLVSRAAFGCFLYQTVTQSRGNPILFWGLNSSRMAAKP